MLLNWYHLQHSSSPNPKVQTLFKQLTFFHAHITQSEDEDGLSLAYELIDAGM